MSLSEEERATLVGLQIEKAFKNMEQADEVYKLRYFDLAANRYYYACFHAIQALLLNVGAVCHTHAGLIAEFGKRFIKTGIMPVAFGQFISRLEQLRERGDYNCSYDITESELVDMIAPAHELLEAIARYLVSSRNEWEKGIS